MNFKNTHKLQNPPKITEKLFPWELVAKLKGLDVNQTKVDVISGHAGITLIPLLLCEPVRSVQRRRSRAADQAHSGRRYRGGQGRHR